MTLTAIVTAHGESPHRILGQLLYQTRRPDEILVFCSDVPDLAGLREDFTMVDAILERPNLMDWGHEKRAEGVLLADSDYIGFFNHDDTYASTYVEEMMARAEAGADVVYCAWNRIPGCGFQTCSSTSGNFIVRTALARAAGYRSRAYEADGHFIEAINALDPKIARVDDILYFHNVAA